MCGARTLRITNRRTTHVQSSDDESHRGAAVLTVGVIASAQSSERATERFSFTIPTAAQQASSNQQRLQLVITRWSTEAERQQALMALEEGGAMNLTRALRRNNAVGYIHWPGKLEYTLRYAWRVPRPDGGADLVLATDAPVSEWWNQKARVVSANESTVIEVRLGKDGQGEGKIAAVDKVTEPGTGKTFVLSDYDKLPAVMADVKPALAAS